MYEQTDTRAILGYDADKCKLELIHLGHPVDHATAFGRIAFSCPRDQLPAIESAIKEVGHTILTPLVSLDTPGKATVEVVILADPVNNNIILIVVLSTVEAPAATTSETSSSYEQFF